MEKAVFKELHPLEQVLKFEKYAEERKFPQDIMQHLSCIGGCYYEILTELSKPEMRNKPLTPVVRLMTESMHNMSLHVGFMLKCYDLLDDECWQQFRRLCEELKNFDMIMDFSDEAFSDPRANDGDENPGIVFVKYPHR